MDPEKLKEILDNLNITQPNNRAFIADRTLCGICQLLVKHIQEKQLSVKFLAQAICNIYITLATLTVSDFCEDVIQIHLVTILLFLLNSEMYFFLFINF